VQCKKQSLADHPGTEGWELLASPRIDELASILRWNAFASAGLLPSGLDASKELDLTSDLLQRGIFRKLGKEVDYDLSVAHGVNISESGANDKFRTTPAKPSLRLGKANSLVNWLDGGFSRAGIDNIERQTGLKNTGRSSRRSGAIETSS
jgi:hypothetical protein